MKRKLHTHLSKTTATCMLALPVFSYQSFAAELAIDVNNDAFYSEFISETNAKDFNASGTLFHHKDHGTTFALGGHVQSALRDNRHITGTLGAKAYYADLDNGSEGAVVGLGGSVDALVSQANNISIEGAFYYVPDVLAFQDYSGAREFWLKAKLKLLENGSAYLGYRNFRLEVEDAGHFDFEKGAMVGIELNF